jgi:hypothetical protein
MRAGTALENWRAAEKSLAAIDGRIAELRRHSELSPTEASALTRLNRARESISRLADKWWAHHLEGFAQPTADAGPGEPGNRDKD